MQLNTYEIYSLNGKLQAQGNLKSNAKNRLNIDQLSAGIYLLRIVGENAINTKKIIKQ